MGFDGIETASKLLCLGALGAEAVLNPACRISSPRPCRCWITNVPSSLHRKVEPFYTMGITGNGERRFSTPFLRYFRLRYQHSLVASNTCAGRQPCVPGISVSFGDWRILWLRCVSVFVVSKADHIKVPLLSDFENLAKYLGHERTTNVTPCTCRPRGYLLAIGRSSR